ncbi:QRFP-like peptide receptor [Haliotis cracherodii]|uniref:QRFP-like peptide receptor n=1 Tax=Haliotis cracherodii TaxID=6455 RepID=UPI0039EC7727
MTIMDSGPTTPSGLPEVDLAFLYEGDLEKLRKPWVREPHFIPMVAVYSVIFLLGVVGNALVICVLCCGRPRQCVTFPGLLSMAWADVLFLLICLPYEIIRFFLSHWELSTFLCKFSGFIEMVSATATTLNLILISVERYFVIAHPLTSKSLCTTRNTKVALILVWLAAILLASPSFVVMDTESILYHNNATSVVVVLCADVGIPDTGRLVYSVWQLCVLFVIPAIVLMFCYIRVIWILWMSTQQLQTMTSPYRSYHQCSNKNRNDSGNWKLNNESPDISRTSNRSRPSSPGEEALQARRQVIKMLVVIIVLFLICWGPKLVIHVMKKLELQALYSPHVFNLTILLTCLPYVQSCLNPFIYVLMSKSIRKTIMTSLPFRLRRYCLCYCCQYRTSGSPVNEMVLTNHSATGQTGLKTSVETFRSYGANEPTDL